MSGSLHRRISAALVRAANFAPGAWMQGEAGENARQALTRAFRQDEDLLTELVFGRLRYLPARVCWRALMSAAAPLRGALPAEPIGALTHRMWPIMPHPRGGEIEPDVIWDTPQLSVIVEVKWSAPQNPDQLTWEYEALAHGQAPLLPIVVVALGNVSPERREQLREQARCPVLLALSWEEFYGSLRQQLTDAPAHEAAVIHDILETIVARLPSLQRTAATLDTLPRPSRPLLPGALARWTPLTRGHRPALPTISPLSLTRWRPHAC